MGAARCESRARDRTPNPHPQPVDAARQLRFPQGEESSSAIEGGGGAGAADPKGWHSGVPSQGFTQRRRGKGDAEGKARTLTQPL